MGVLVSVVAHRLLLDGFLGDLAGDADDSLLIGRGRAGGNLECVERAAGVAVAHLRPVGHRRFLDLDLLAAETALFVCHRAAEDLGNFRLGEGLELEDLRARDERVDDEKEGVVGRGPDEGEHPALHVGEENVLLGLVQAVDFIEEEDGFPPSESPLGCCGGHLADIGHGGLDPAQPLEMALGGIGDDGGQGGLPGAGRAEKDHRLDAIRLNQAAEQAPGSQQVLLPDDVVEVSRAHPRGEGGLRARTRLWRLLEDFVGHARSVAWARAEVEVGYAEGKLQSRLRAVEDLDAWVQKLHGSKKSARKKRHFSPQVRNERRIRNSKHSAPTVGQALFACRLRIRSRREFLTGLTGLQT